jgi:hypothetical protein
VTLLEEFATLAALLKLGIYSTGADSTIFVRKLPDTPDTAIAVARYGGPESDAALGYDTLSLQFRVRGPNTDYRIAEATAQQVYDKLHGLHDRALPGGTWLVLMVGVQGGPVDLGEDVHGRPEYVINLRAEVARSTPNRD